jgi:hypothetical protein
LQAQSNEFKSQYSQRGKKIFGAEGLAKWKSVFSACTRPQVQFPSISKSKKKNGKEDKWHKHHLIHLIVEGLKKRSKSNL